MLAVVAEFAGRLRIREVQVPLGASCSSIAVLATLMVPFQITMIPIYVTLANLGLINTYWGVILPGTASAFGIFLIRQFMQSIPDELLDAARIDGASELGIFVRIVVPLARAGDGRAGDLHLPRPLERLPAATAGPEPLADVHAARSGSRLHRRIPAEWSRSWRCR